MNRTNVRNLRKHIEDDLAEATQAVEDDEQLDTRGDTPKCKFCDKKATKRVGDDDTVPACDDHVGMAKRTMGDKVVDIDGDDGSDGGDGDGKRDGMVGEMGSAGLMLPVGPDGTKEQAIVDSETEGRHAPKVDTKDPTRCSKCGKPIADAVHAAPND